MTRKPVNLHASIGTRLRNIALARQADLAFIFRRYAIERLLYRLSVSDQRDRFVLKGAMLFTAWMPDPFRPTQDLDLLGFGDDDVAAVAASVAVICNQDVAEDGLHFDADTIKAEAIRAKQDYGGVRVRLTAFLGRTRIPVQIDVGFGDAVTPAITELEFPPLLDAPAPASSPGTPASFGDGLALVPKVVDCPTTSPPSAVTLRRPSADTVPVPS